MLFPSACDAGHKTTKVGSTTLTSMLTSYAARHQKIVKHRIQGAQFRNVVCKVKSDLWLPLARCGWIFAQSSVVAVTQDMFNCGVRSEEHTSEIQSLMRI